MELIKDALAVEKAGGFALLVEAVPPEVGRIITDMLKTERKTLVNIIQTSANSLDTLDVKDQFKDSILLLLR